MRVTVLGSTKKATAALNVVVGGKQQIQHVSSATQQHRFTFQADAMAYMKMNIKYHKTELERTKTNKFRICDLRLIFLILNCHAKYLSTF